MEQLQTTRQQKISRQIQRDIAEILQRDGAAIAAGSMITVTPVRVSPDFGYAKIYFSIFPFDRSEQVMKSLNDNNWFLRREVGMRIRNLLMVVPELQFFLDDSLEYIENIDSLLKE